MDEYVLTDVLEGSFVGMPSWLIIMRKPDGTNHGHTLPKHTLDARAIEHDIDPKERELLFDVVVHEAWAVDPLDEIRVAKYGDPAVALGLTVPTLAGGEIGVNCFSADTLADAQTAHLARFSHCQSGIVTVRRKLRQVDSILKHVEDDWSCAHIEKGFRAERKMVRNEVREARRAAANR